MSMKAVANIGDARAVDAMERGRAAFHDGVDAIFDLLAANRDASRTRTTPTAIADTPQWYTRAQAARYLGLGTTSLDALVRRHAIDVHRADSPTGLRPKMRFSREALDAYLARLERNAS